MEKAQEEINEEVAIKLEDMEDGFIALKDFVLEKLEVFGEKLETLEKTTTSDVSALKRDIQDLSGSVIIASPLLSSTPNVELPEPQASGSCISLASPEPVRNPKFLEELHEGEIKTKLSAYYDPNIDLKEKLSPVQVAFVLYWLNGNPEATGRKRDGDTLRLDEINAGIWTEDFSPDTPNNFPFYLCDKIKTIITKKNKKERRELFRKEFESMKKGDN